MHWLGELGRRIGMLLRKRQFDADLEEEMRLHQELRAEENLRAGRTPEDARFAAKKRFGNATVLREESHMAWGWGWFEQFAQDVNYGVRAMLRSPGITIVALLSLALGIGANTAIFSLVDAVMLRSLPVKEPKQLVVFGEALDSGISDQFAHGSLYSYPFYREAQKRNHVFSGMAAVFSMLNDTHGTVEGRGEAEPMNIQLVSGTYFPVLGVQPAMGRVFTDEDDRIKDGNPVAVVSYTWWKRNLASDATIVGKKLTIDSAVFTIVGVAPPEFFGTSVGELPDIWVPLSMQKEVPPHWDGYNQNFTEPLYLIGRLKPGVNMAQANTEANLLFHQILRGFPDAPLSQENLETLNKTQIKLTSISGGLNKLRREASEPLMILMTIVGLVLLIACANIANLLLARSTARAREFAVRQALGARRSRLIRQLLTESLLLAIAGGALGIAFAAGASRLLLRMVSNGPEPLPLDVSINVRLMLFTLTVAGTTAILFGTIPAFRATRLQLTESLKDGRGLVGTGAKSPLAKGLVISQIAFSLVLLVGAGLFLRSLINLMNVDTGFNKENVLRIRMDVSSAGYKRGEDARLIALYQQIEERVHMLTGVRAASISMWVYNEGSWNNRVSVQGFEVPRDNNVKHNVIGADYFATMGISLLTGRTFGPQDTATSQKVAVISETMARTLFPPGSVIGHHYGRGGPENANNIEVIGIVKDAKFGSLQETPQQVDYLPYVQEGGYLNDLQVRYAGDFSSTASAVRRAIHQVDRNLPIAEITTLDEQIARSIIGQRLVAQLSTFFGLLAVFLSCIGIYGVMSYVVARRTNEIGVRMALGAGRSHVLWLVMREILWMVVIGVAIGVPVALAGDRFVSSMLFGLKATDPLSLLGAVVILLLVAAFAGYLPARRASRVDPMVALRYE